MISTLTRSQMKVFGWKTYSDGGTVYRIRAKVRHDDECGNGHNTFAITGETQRKAGNGQWVSYSYGCLHDEIGKHFPELKPLIKWHLTNTDGPMHYKANTLYLAGNRDFHGKLRGEPKAWDKFITFGTSPIRHKLDKRLAAFIEENAEALRAGEIDYLGIDHDRDRETYGTYYTPVGFASRWHECPWRTKSKADQWMAALAGHWLITTEATAWSNGKERELDAARISAVWPDATDEELMADDLGDKLDARLPALLEEFREAVESLGFVY